MKSALLACLVSAAALVTLAAPARASILDTPTQPAAHAVELFGTFHDAQTGFVFVKLPDGWRFVAADGETRHHAVFLDAGTGFVYVKLSDGWRFVSRLA